MPLSQDHITGAIPLGANLIADGCTFRVWAPRANRVHLVRPPADGSKRLEDPTDGNLLVRRDGGYWAGFLAGVRDGEQYMFYVVSDGGDEDPKRDPYTRELTTNPPYPTCNCIIRDPNSLPWHDKDGNRRLSKTSSFISFTWERFLDQNAPKATLSYSTFYRV